MNTTRHFVKVAGIMLAMAMAGCAPDRISKTIPSGIAATCARVEIVNNTSYDVDKISGLLGNWDSSLFPLIPAGEVRYVRADCMPKAMSFQYALKMGTPIRLYANGRWSKMRLVDSSGGIHENWYARGVPPDGENLFRHGMSLYLVNGNNGDLYLTNVPIR